jgi:dTMP kinase
MRGRFITLEGGEGAGKSTQARLLADALRDAGHQVLLTREPGGTAGAEAIRTLLVTGDADRWQPWSETLLLMAARIDHVERVIRPALAAGQWVICDRFVDSTRAYQGGGKGLDDAELVRLHDRLVGLWPDRTLVLQLPPAAGLARALTRDGSAGRFEAHELGFHQRLHGFFAQLCAAEASRCLAIDADQPVAGVAAAIAAAMAAPWP